MLGTHPFVRFLNQNRRQIRITIIAIVIFFLMLKGLNSLVEKENEKQVAKNNAQITEKVTANNYQEIVYKFLKYCIEGDESSAYALLSSENKSFINSNDFKKNYITKYFSTSKNYTVIYKSNSNGIYSYTVKIFDDILSTGKVTDDKPIVQEFKVKQENERYKIIEIN